MSRLGLYWDWFQLQWGEWIINYDFFHQYTLAQTLHEASRDWTQQAHTRFERARDAGAAWVKAWQARLAAAPLWIFILLAALAGITLCLSNAALRAQLFGALKDRWLLGWKLRTHHGAIPPHAAAIFYRRMLHLLEKRGWRKLEAQTPLEFAASLPPGAVSAPVADLTALYLAARFGASNTGAVSAGSTGVGDGEHTGAANQPAADAKRFAALLSDVQASLRARPTA